LPLGHLDSSRTYKQFIWRIGIDDLTFGSKFPQSSDALYEGLMRTGTAQGGTRLREHTRRAATRSRETLPRSFAPSSQRGLQTLLHEDESSQRLTLSGELDMATAPDFEEAMLRALGARRPIVLDLRRLSFIDSAGLWAVTLGHTACRRRGIALSIELGSGSVRQVFEATGLFDVLPFADSPQSA